MDVVYEEDLAKNRPFSSPEIFHVSVITLWNLLLQDLPPSKDASENSCSKPGELNYCSHGASVKFIPSMEFTPPKGFR